MANQVVRDGAQKMKHVVHIRQHALAVDEPEANGGEDLGPTPHEVYDSALGACKALPLVWYARRKQIPLEDVQVSVERDDSQERAGLYRLQVRLTLGGSLTEVQREELLRVADKCPVHKLMTQGRTEVSTSLA
jgi:putative redox protein